MLAGGIIFQLPLAILAVTRLGIVTVEQLTKNRRYAYLAIAIVAAALPGVDPISMLIEMVPLLVLFELSILIARAFGTPKAAGGIGRALNPGAAERSWQKAASDGCSSTFGDGDKHVVRVVYAILALLMGASLFLVVGPFSIADIFNTASTTTPATVLDEQAERLEARLRTEPDNENLLLTLTRTRIAAGNAQTDVNPETGLPTLKPEGREDLILASEAWDRYLKQADEPSPSGALLMAGAYFALAESGGTSFEEVESFIDGAVATQRIAADARPSIGTLTSLAIYEYFANDFATGDKVAREAVAMAPKAQASEIKKQLNEYRQSGKAFEAQKKEFVKVEKEQGKEALQNPLSGLGGGSLGQ